MLFNSYEFIFIFLPICILGFYLINNSRYTNYSYVWIFLCSIFFYLWWNIYFILLILLTIGINHYLGNLIIAKREKKYFIFGILFQLFILGYFKYKNFFLENLNLISSNNFEIEQIILPLGISFFTFKHILYLVECYKESNKSHYSLLDYSTYITFFPHLIAGPLSKPKEILPQIKKKKYVNLNNLNLGLILFFIGLFKKVVLADTFASYSDDPFNAVDNGYQISFFESWLSMISFSLQIYFDFSGYTDMATGLAKIFGITLPINFNSPYKSKSIIEFWRKWHITLSRFLKECVYIPLGGNRNGRYISFLYILITMLVGGLWHGASWNFVIWGFFHAILIIINHTYNLVFKKKENYIFQNLINIIKVAFTFFFVSFGWIIFKTSSMMSAKIFFSGLFGLNGFALNPNLEKYVNDTLFLNLLDVEFKNIFYYGSSQIYFIIVGLFVVFLMPNTLELMKNYKIVLPFDGQKKLYKKNKMDIFFKFNTKWAIFVAFITVCAITALSNVSREFIYYQF